MGLERSGGRCLLGSPSRAGRGSTPTSAASLWSRIVIAWNRTARSDVDLILLTDTPSLYTEGSGWIAELGGARSWRPGPAA